ncbi:hypothetical protein NDU88_004478 [Pleurodeles waltl]|uniref:Uncharacterized protein n=1 Tax=Pleurodeles waltl TaxID=8319 RepID=A0AAV7MA71_PLEWA|nr:hypothetical protein NDU88_004478 [Pleurodeles waltl]
MTGAEEAPQAQEGEQTTQLPEEKNNQSQEQTMRDTDPKKEHPRRNTSPGQGPTTTAKHTDTARKEKADLRPPEQENLRQGNRAGPPKELKKKLQEQGRAEKTKTIPRTKKTRRAPQPNNHAGLRETQSKKRANQGSTTKEKSGQVATARDTQEPKPKTHRPKTQHRHHQKPGKPPTAHPMPDENQTESCHRTREERKGKHPRPHHRKPPGNRKPQPQEGTRNKEAPTGALPEGKAETRPQGHWRQEAPRTPGPGDQQGPHHPGTPMDNRHKRGSRPWGQKTTATPTPAPTKK